ncbi:hypothetical protein EYF80_061939 [Liparis tanakae]|uniref:Uncharacterized protein n=1 Tax=Liparis tanakae TaxID=230148 RepID=A0A4Z2EHH2_9TELE|nr:hypothetical protein EYF80_061939 [Liparis tanakae]
MGRAERSEVRQHDASLLKGTEAAEGGEKTSALIYHVNTANIVLPVAPERGSWRREPLPRGRAGEGMGATSQGPGTAEGSPRGGGTGEMTRREREGAAGSTLNAGLH